MEMQKLGHQQRLEEIEVQADIVESKALYKHDRPVGVAWVDSLRASVRPVITYAFFLLFAAVKGSGLYCQRRSKIRPPGRSKIRPLDVVGALMLRVVPVVPQA